MTIPPKGGNVAKKRSRCFWVIVLALAVGLGIPVAGILIIIGYFLWEYYHPQ